MMEIDNTRFTENTSVKKGGAIYAWCHPAGEYYVKIRNSYFYGCNSDVGAAIDVQNCDLILEKSKLKENWSKSSASGIKIMSDV